MKILLSILFSLIFAITVFCEPSKRSHVYLYQIHSRTRPMRLHKTGYMMSSRRYHVQGMPSGMLLQRQNIVAGCRGCSEKGVCYRNQQTWKQGCWTKKCSVYPGGYGWKTEIAKTECQWNGTCISNGKKLHGGRCYCSVNGVKWQIICPV